MSQDKIYKMACVSSEGSEQPKHLPSLISVLLYAQWVAKDPSFLHADSEAQADLSLRWTHMPFCSITKTRLYNFDPLKPHFYIVKLGFTGVYIIFLIC